MNRELVMRICDFFDQRIAYPLFGDPDPGSSGDALTALTFHRLFLDEELEGDDGGYRHERVKVSQFEAIVERFADAGYMFATPQDVIEGKTRGRRAVMLTFDDGYADNLRALPILKRHQARAVFFISPGPLIRREAFWWDVVYRESAKRSIGKAETAQLARRMRTYGFDQIQENITRNYGHDAFRETYLADRPMTPAELAEAAASGHIEIGNHTYDHMALTRGDTADQVQLTRSQEALLRLTGRRPLSFSFPHGLCSPQSIEAVASAGLQFAANMDYRLNLTEDAGRRKPDRLMQVSRMSIFGDRPLDGQFAACRGRVSSGRALAATAKYLAGLRAARLAIPLVMACMGCFELNAS